RRGLFVGMVTLDLVYLTAQLPSNNQKVVASDYTVAAGGPATNAAVAFSYLGNQATILGAVGTHAVTHLIRDDLERHGVAIADLNPNSTQTPPVASILVTQSTGDRAVISLEAAKVELNYEHLLATLRDKVDIVLIDGHQMAAGRAIAEIVKDNNIPVVMDAGSWKPGFETILPFVDYAICSANFYPPSCATTTDVINYLTTAGISHIAITQGEKPILYFSDGVSGQLPVPQIDPVDTMGAGDVFHGAFCHYILEQNFIDALVASAKIAAHSCQFFGTRQWMQ
ncbi:MAG TPA: sugar kinase, partial [Coleofasciculaceae cyanobacterium]